MKNQTYDIYYDEEADFLEVFFGEPKPSYAIEPEEGIFVRKDQETDEVKSVGIIGYSKKQDRLRNLLVKLNKKLPKYIDISK